MSLRDTVVKQVHAVLHSDGVIRRRFPDIDPKVLDIFAKVKPFTMTSPERIISLCEAVR